MRARSVLGRSIVGAILVAAVATPVQAGATATTIELRSLSSGETFTTTGGVLCPDGTATTDFHRFGGSDRSRAGTFHLDKIMTCSDGSGTFTIRVDAATRFGSPTDQGGWSVLGGTGDYEGLKGGGNLVGTYVEDGIIDLYTGLVSL
jgi:hypothetical protein